MRWFGTARLLRCLLWLAVPGAVVRPANQVLVQQYATSISNESPAAREARHRAVAGRRRGPVVMVHRGATAMAPENSIEACVAALTYGADGCEVDLRRTSDGVLVLFHDGSLDRISDGFGRVSEATYRELGSLKPRLLGGRPLFSPPPTFAALLDVARQQAMLLHLDLKEPGLEADVARLLDEADAWDHVVQVNPENAAILLRHPQLRPLTYKAPGLYQDRRDLDPAAVATAVAQPGQMILVDDPRVATRILGRPSHRPQPYTKTERIIAAPPLAGTFSGDGAPTPLSVCRALAALPQANSPAWLTRLIDGRVSVAGPRNRLIERAWAAQRLGELGRKPRLVISTLRRMARQPTAHPDWAYHGLDALAAIRALGRLQATECAPDLIALLYRSASRGSSGDNGGIGNEANASPALREAYQCRLTLYVLQALGELRCRPARRFLDRTVRLREDRMRRFGPPQYAEATRALLHQRLAWDDVADLLRSPNSEVRGTALIECLDSRTEERTMALRIAAPWALDLPRARR